MHANVASTLFLVLPAGRWPGIVGEIENRPSRDGGVVQTDSFVVVSFKVVVCDPGVGLADGGGWRVFAIVIDVVHVWSRQLTRALNIVIDVVHVSSQRLTKVDG